MDREAQGRAKESKSMKIEVQIVQYDDEMSSFGKRRPIQSVKIGSGYVAFDSEEDPAE